MDTIALFCILRYCSKIQCSYGEEYEKTWIALWTASKRLLLCRSTPECLRCPNAFVHGSVCTFRLICRHRFRRASREWRLSWPICSWITLLVPKNLPPARLPPRNLAGSLPSRPPKQRHNFWLWCSKPHTTHGPYNWLAGDLLLPRHAPFGC